MSYSLGDLALGVVQIFVILVPGAAALGVLAALEPSAAVLELAATHESVAWVTALVASVVSGHLVSFAGSALEDGIARRSPTAIAAEHPELRYFVACLLHAERPALPVTAGSLRRRALAVLRAGGGDSVRALDQADADRRFFRNLTVVFGLAAVVFGGDLAIDVVNSSLAPWSLGLAATGGVLGAVSWMRFRDQDSKFTRAVFETLLAKSTRNAGATSDSLEVRWFVPEASVPIQTEASDVPLPVHRFKSVIEDELKGSVTAVRERHHYLPVTSASTASKVRSGRLERKDRLSSTTIELGSVAGRIEAWRKRTLFDDAPPIDSVAPLVAVDKERYVARVRLAADELEALADGARLETGCQVELARVVRSGAVEWTLGFEAFGPDAEHVLAAAAKVIAPKMEAALDELTLDRSYGYPAALSGKEANNG